MSRNESISTVQITPAMIEANFPSSFELIVKLSNSLLPDSTLVNETILLGSALNHRQKNGITKEQMTEYLDLSVDLLQRIDNELKTTKNIDKWNDINKLRRHFLQKFEQKLVLKATKITKSYPRSKFVLDNINLDVHSGEIIGVIGENGNGKTTLLKIIAGEIYASSGAIKYPGIHGNDKGSWSIRKKYIAYVPQKIKDWGNLDTLKNQLHFSASIKGVRGKDNNRIVNHFIQRLDLGRYQHLYWKEISGGTQLRFEIAKALLWKPNVVILDEPLANLDVKAQTVLLTDLRNIVNSINHPTAILISSQNLFELEKISDKIIFLRRGKALYNGITENIGANNDFNCFQIDSSWDIDDMKLRLNTSHIKRLEFDGHFITMYTPKNVGKREILKELVNKDVPILYFRDISNSTRILFESKNNNDE